MKTTDLISYILAIIGILVALTIVLYFKFHSPDFLTHEQFYVSMSAMIFAFISVFAAIWTKMTEFAKDLGEIKGTLRQYINNHPRRKK